jgi:hypothetical protein
VSRRVICTEFATLAVGGGLAQRLQIDRRWKDVADPSK